jgi:hypothetical protein
VPLPGIEYAIRGTSYQLIAVVDGRPLTFTSSDDRETFRRAR